MALHRRRRKPIGNDERNLVRFSRGREIGRIGLSPEIGSGEIDSPVLRQRADANGGHGRESAGKRGEIHLAMHRIPRPGMRELKIEDGACGQGIACPAKPDPCPRRTAEPGERIEIDGVHADAL
jgi:hypothetical protein